MCVSRSLWLDSSLFSSVCPLKTTPAILYHCILSNSSNDSKTTWLNVIFPFFFYSIMQMYYNAKLTNAAANLLEQVNLNFLHVITAFSTISWHILFSCFRCNRSVAGKINKILVLIAFCLSVCLQLYRVSLKKNRWKRSLRRRKREWLNVVKRSHVRGSWGSSTFDWALHVLARKMEPRHSTLYSLCACGVPVSLILGLLF